MHGLNRLDTTLIRLASLFYGLESTKKKSIIRLLKSSCKILERKSKNFCLNESMMYTISIQPPYVENSIYYVDVCPVLHMYVHNKH